MPKPVPNAPPKPQTVTPHAYGGPDHPHEPAGFVAFAEFPCDRLPSGPRSQAGKLGTWYAFPPGNRNLSLESDNSAPASPPGVCQTRYPASFQGGKGPVNWGGWDAAGFADAQKSKIYFSLWIRIVGENFENHPAGSKVGFFGYGAKFPSSQNQGFFFLAGSGRQEAASRFKIEFRQQGIRQPNGWVVRNLVQNRSSGAAIIAGRWQHWEAVLELNELSRANGVFRMWVDGNLVLDYSDVTYVTPDAPLGFNLWKWNPTWGGHNRANRTREDFIQIDDVYLSGVPMTGGVP